ncbi:hypothetical protein ATJ97_3200 [Georgenia soli]|uniref:DUF6457 domain-containing protein n=1 Tax=Georgenia soli TaxID=638953 RepID=A0A2A9EP25_9MICO|nr:DUF6457 domain-containing protein [Georgenia soli]PFG40668.1 hypothetical protein ATJ97_3200 [Georgenia soli]
MSAQGADGAGTADRSARPDEARKMVAMNAWLDDVCAQLGVERDLVGEVTPPMLRLIGEVAHGPSRPGAPLTAFVVGLAAARAGGTDPSAAVTDRVDAVRALVARWAERQDDASPGGTAAGTSPAAAPGDRR